MERLREEGIAGVSTHGTLCSRCQHAAHTDHSNRKLEQRSAACNAGPGLRPVRAEGGMQRRASTLRGCRMLSSAHDTRTRAGDGPTLTADVPSIGPRAVLDCSWRTQHAPYQRKLTAKEHLDIKGDVPISFSSSLQVAPCAGTAGTLDVWALIDGAMHRMAVAVPRTLYVDVASDAASLVSGARRVRRTLPDGAAPEALLEVTMSEADFLDGAAVRHLLPFLIICDPLYHPCNTPRAGAPVQPLIYDI
jgi:hypothetical protein